ncbi:MAG: RagB/SusD family nutrient uptake outer membrane protein [Bacteroidaceae bacterium]|nr:RagB/SusD family nutrient uptake outer membrane protein [Bacteroidaceae bacterium]
MPEVIGRFSFLKRTGLAKSELGFEDYQLLLPIPSNEIQKNPNLTQNPGY